MEVGWARAEGSMLQCWGITGFQHALRGIFEIDAVKG